MSSLSSNDSSTFGNAACQNSSRPKFQPIRVKALLHFCESDDDEGEDKPRNTDSDSGSESELEHLPETDSTENVIYQMSRCKTDPKLLSNVKVENQDSQVAQGTLNTSSILKEQFNSSNHGKEPNSYVITSEASIITNIHYGERDVSDDIHNVKSGEHKEPWIPNDYQVDVKDICKHDTSKYVKTLINSDIDYNVKAKKSIRQEVLADVQIENHNVHQQSDKISQHISKSMEISNENGKENLNCDHDHHLSKLTNEMPMQMRECDIRDQCNSSTKADTKCEQTVIAVHNSESYVYDSSNSHLHNPKSELVEPEAFTNKDILCRENVNVGLAPHTADNLVINTPLKHAMTSSHPNPCLSRKKLIQTPQNELQKNLTACSGEIPATILCQRVHNNIRQTPLQCKILNKKDFMQTPNNAVHTPNIIKHETPRYFGMESKTIRRPLTDAMSLTQNSNPIFSFQSKSSTVNSSHLPKVESTRLEVKSDHCISKNSDIYSMDKKKMDELQNNYVHIQSILSEQLKENKHPNTLEVLQDNETFDKVLENRKTFVNANAQADINKDSQKQCTAAINSHPKLIPKESQARYPVSNDSNQQRNMKHVMDTLSNVQFSVPSNISKLKDSKMLLIKGKEYLILGSLGQGMSGEVVRVQDTSSLELRAIKCVNLSLMDKDSAQGCLEEISMLHKLQAPCIIKMFDYEIKYPMVYVVMEMGDTDLSRLLKTMLNEKQLPLTMILYYWTEMLTAVKYIHNNGVIHSDLKPANFLLVRGRLKLIDFGIASSINADMTSVVKNCPIGTLNYISPEALMDISDSGDSPTQNVKYKISFKSDVWSLGCILYSLVYGHTPFHHIRSQWAKVNAITNPKPNISYPMSVSTAEDGNERYTPPPILIDVMKKCLQHDPKMRPTVTQLLQLEYVPTKPDVTLILRSDIPANVLVKIKHALSEEEWRHLIQALENRRYT